MKEEQYTLLEKRAGEVERLAESVLADSDGLIRSGADAGLLRPFRPGELPQCLSLRPQLDPVELFSYEDSLMATAEYLLAGLYRNRVQPDSPAAGYCRRSFHAIRQVAEAAASCRRGVVRPMFGFLPKPYGGVRGAADADEVSIDQYQKVMTALLYYQKEQAGPEEHAWIDRFLEGCADCWELNHYTFSYFGSTVRWGACGRHAIAFGAFCSAVGGSFRREPHDCWYGIFRHRAEAEIRRAPGAVSDNMASLVLLAAGFLCERKPEEREFWLEFATRTWEAARAGCDERGRAWLFPGLYGYSPGKRIEPHWVSEETSPPCGWEFLRWRGNLFRPCSVLAAAALDLYELTEDGAFLAFAEELLLRLAPADLNYLLPESPADLPPGYEKLEHMLNGYNAAAWLRAYWQWRAGHAVK